MRAFLIAVVTSLFLLSGSTVQALQVVNLFPGDEITDGTDIETGATVNVLGGSIGLGVDLSDGVLNVQSGSVALGAGSIATGFTNSNNMVQVSGGSVGGFFQLTNNTQLDVSGGQLESFGVFTGSSANITGGVVTRFPDIFASGVVNISGGNVFSVRVFSGGEVNFFGTEFFLDSEPIDLTLNEEFVITDRNVTLTGILQDGSSIETSLNTSFGGFFSSNPDGAAATARVTVTLVPDLPPLVVLGDVDMNGAVEFADIPAFIAILQAGTFTAEADINLDEQVTFADIPGFIAILSAQ